MKNKKHGPSFYYANDKNIFDALNEHKVDAETVAGLFEKRNTLVSSKDSRESLARYFSSLPHDYFDHKDIANCLGVVSRRERVTSLDLVVAIDAKSDHLDQAIVEATRALQEDGNVVQTTRSAETVTLHVQYIKIDYGRSEFNQIQTKDGSIEFHKTPQGYTIRSTQNEYMNNVRDGIVENISRASSSGAERREVSLLAWPDPNARSNFFFDLFTGIPGYDHRDVTDIYVYKPTENTDALEIFEDSDSHVIKVSLKGTGVTRSAFLSDLAGQGYYTFRVGWKSQDKGAQGNVYAIEAVFADPEKCIGFSYILLGVHQNNNGTIQKQRRAPMKGEISEVSRAVEMRARELMEELRSGFDIGTSDEGEE